MLRTVLFCGVAGLLLSAPPALAQECEPELISSIGGLASDVQAEGSLAYVANYSGLYIYNVTGTKTPELIGRLDTPDQTWGLFVSGTVAYLADRASGLQIVDVSDRLARRRNRARPTTGWSGRRFRATAQPALQGQGGDWGLGGAV